MRIFLTGATGFLGSHTAEELAKRGHELTALFRDRGKTRVLESIPVRWIQGSLNDLSNLSEHLNNLDAVIHIAGITKALSRAEFFRSNALGTENLVRTTGKLAKPPRIFLHVSTIAVHHVGGQGGDFTEPPERCSPLTHYGESKLAGEKALSGLPVEIRQITLRPPVLYGPRDTEFLPMFQAASLGLVPLWGRGENQVSVCYVTDVARALAELVEKPLDRHAIYCLDDGKVHDWRNLLAAVSQAIGKSPKALKLPPFLFYTAAAFSQTWAQLSRRPNIFTLNKIKEMRQANWVCGHQALTEATGWRPKVTLEEGFVKTWEYYRGLKN